MAKQTIKLKVYVDIMNEYNAASATIYPGMLLELTSSGIVQANSEAGLACAKMFAVEDELQGQTIDDLFTISNPVQCWSTIPGEEVLAWVANGEDIAIGDYLVSNGDGKLKEFTADDSASIITEETPIAVAVEAVDMSGSSAADPTGRIKVRIL